MDSHELIGTSAEEIELLKLVDLQKLIEEEAGEAVPRPATSPALSNVGKASRGTDSLFDRELRQELAAEKHERLRLFEELDRVKKLLASKTSELENQQKRIEALAQDAEQAKALLRERESAFTQKLVALEQAHIKSIQDERARLDSEIAKEKLAADEVLAREATFRIQMENERKIYEEKIALVSADLNQVRAEIAERDKRTTDLRAEFEKASEQLSERTEHIDKMAARLRILEAEKELLSTDLEQRKKIFAAAILDRESGLRKSFESEKEALQRAFEEEKVDLSAKLLREKAVRETLEQQKKSYSEKMIELAWELKERERAAQRQKAKEEVRSELSTPAEIPEAIVSSQPVKDTVPVAVKSTAEILERDAAADETGKNENHQVTPSVESVKAVGEVAKVEPESTKTAGDVPTMEVTESALVRTKEELAGNPFQAPTSADASELRRLAAGLIDYIFVLTLWVIALVLTANIFSGFSSGFSPKVFDQFAHPAFFRAVVVEYAILWLAYFALSVGLVNRTCGMWVWDIRVEYPKNIVAGICSRMARVLLSTFFFAPLISVTLLSLRRKNRNLLDFLSQSRVVLHASDVIRGQLVASH